MSSSVGDICVDVFQRAGLAPVIAEKLKAEKNSIEKMVKDAEMQLSSELHFFIEACVSHQHRISWRLRPIWNPSN